MEDQVLHCLGIQQQGITHESTTTIPTITPTGATCSPVILESSMKTSNCTLSEKQRCCQVCLFEGGGRFHKTVGYCKRQHIWACLTSPPDQIQGASFFEYRSGKKFDCTAVSQPHFPAPTSRPP
eukprot:3167508-Ditylum_brightwellii.AAC.1